MVAGMHSMNARPAPGLTGPDGTGEADSLQLARGLLSWGGAQPETVLREPRVLRSDPRVAAVPVRDCGEPLTELDESFGPCRALVRVSVARRLALARDALPRGVGLRVVDGYQTAAAQRAIISSYAAQLRTDHTAIGAAALDRLTSRLVAPLAVAPHVAGAAADLTLVDNSGRDLDLGTPVDATPEQSEGAFYFDAPRVSSQARANRELLARVLRGRRPGELPDRVVALELRRPVLGTGDRRSGRAVLGRPDGARMVAPALEIGERGHLQLPGQVRRPGRPAGPNEINTMPGFTEHSQVPRMFAAAGLRYPELLDLLVSDALSGQAVAL